MRLLLSLLVSPALAEETSDDALGVLLDAAAAEQARGDTEAARDLYDWVGNSPAPTAVRDEARRRLTLLPRKGADWTGVTQLVGWQTIAGAWLLGPNVALNTSRWVHPNVTLGGMVVGGAVGAGSAMWYSERTAITHGRATGIITAQQLFMLNGVAATNLIDDTRVTWPLGLTAGAVLGTGAGYFAATRDLDEGQMAFLQSGMVWGAYGGALALGSGAWSEKEGTWTVPWLAMTADVGAGAGLLVARAAHLDRGDARWFNAGGLLGAAATGAFMGATSEVIEWQEDIAFPVLGFGTLAGGIIAAAANRNSEKGPPVAAGSLLSGEPGHLTLGFPVPAVRPGGETSVSLVDMRF